MKEWIQNMEIGQKGNRIYNNLLDHSQNIPGSYIKTTIYTETRDGDSQTQLMGNNMKI